MSDRLNTACTCIGHGKTCPGCEAAHLAEDLTEKHLWTQRAALGFAVELLGPRNSYGPGFKLEVELAGLGRFELAVHPQRSRFGDDDDHAPTGWTTARERGRLVGQRYEGEFVWFVWQRPSVAAVDE